MIDALHDDQIPREMDPQCGLPIGPKLVDASPARWPEPVVLQGRFCTLEPLNAERHLEQLYQACTSPDAAARFRYMPDPAPGSMKELENWIRKVTGARDPMAFAVIDRRTDTVQGRQTLMRITPAHQCIEIGNIYWGPAIAGTQVSTEANYLFARYVFEELGYRRYEWKCDALNAPSRRAALRFGFTFEGHFRRAVITRNRSRDTCWYAMIDEEWPALKGAYECWLSDANFDGDGRQRQRLGDLIAKAMHRPPAKR